MINNLSQDNYIIKTLKENKQTQHARGFFDMNETNLP
jgi:hypothetical protein